MPQPSRPTAARQALLRLLDHPELPSLLPSLPAPALARLYDTVGLHDAGRLMVATPLPLLARALDEALWPADGGPPDPDVLIDWIAVWLEEGDEFAASALGALDEDLLALCLDPLLRVEDSHVTAFSRLSEEGELDPDHYDDVLDDGPSVATYDRFRMVPLEEDAWDVIDRAFTALWTHDPERLTTLLERLARTEYRSESDVESKRHRALDLTAAREAQRERAGYVGHDAARGFLALASAMSLEELLSMDGYDPETARQLGERRRGGAADPSPGGQVADQFAAGGRSHGDSQAGGRSHGGSHAGGRSPGEHDAWALLAAAGIALEPTPAPRLTGPRTPTPLTLTNELQRLAGQEPGAFDRCGAELAYLANVLLSVTAADADARELAFATANLGLELITARGLSAGLDRPPGLIRAFLVGWRAQNELPDRVASACATALEAPAVRRRLDGRDWLDGQVQASCVDLRSEVAGGRFDAARNSLAVLSLALNVEVCRAVASLLDRPPRFPCVLEGGEPRAARWIRERADLVTLGAAFARLPEREDGGPVSRARRRAPSSARSRRAATTSPSARGRKRESPE
ncbi:MAG TPA: hypothetical protein VF210_07385 [Pseudomonadales bacterium]